MNEEFGRSCFSRPVQELLDQHDQALQGHPPARVKVARLGQEIRITVQDNGVGFDTRALLRRQEENDCFGLYSVQERHSVSSEAGRCSGNPEVNFRQHEIHNLLEPLQQPQA